MTESMDPSCNDSTLSVWTTSQPDRICGCSTKGRIARVDFRILVVDDDVQIRRVLRAALSAARYEVDTAASGEESLEMMKDRQYHLVLLDLSMPGVDGFELCRELRATSDAEIIIISVSGIEQDIITGLDA